MIETIYSNPKLLERGAPRLYPFFLQCGEDCYVSISVWDLSFQDIEWMNDPNLGEDALVPSIDLQAGLYRFDSELEALRFIQAWWAAQIL